VAMTKALYEDATQQFKHAIELHNDLGAIHPDGSIRRATQVYNSSLRAFSKALLRYNRFLLDGKLPPDEEGPESPGTHF
jgi:hypothetical protein